ncbi:hypothetical protein RRG08_038489 [Elysia crispata]|uniref:Uncharacterized protein n=1 Tax=Elysia crispata TaxID=231223 RepID=A0AAE1DYM1_9GAST|nr:hypothetical protein RRG08_038489 [Elysia crispata]
MDMNNWDKNHLGAKRVKENRYKMTGMYPTLSLAVVEYRSKQKPLSLLNESELGQVYKDSKALGLDQ